MGRSGWWYAAEMQIHQRIRNAPLALLQHVVALFEFAHLEDCGLVLALDRLQLFL